MVANAQAIIKVEPYWNVNVAELNKPSKRSSSLK